MEGGRRTKGDKGNPVAKRWGEVEFSFYAIGATMIKHDFIVCLFLEERDGYVASVAVR